MAVHCRPVAQAAAAVDNTVVAALVVADMVAVPAVGNSPLAAVLPLAVRN
jgi:hypothetical protein